MTDEDGTAEEKRAALIASGKASEDDLFIKRVIVEPDSEFVRRERERNRPMLNRQAPV